MKTRISIIIFILVNSIAFGKDKIVPLDYQYNRYDLIVSGELVDVLFRKIKYENSDWVQTVHKIKILKTFKGDNKVDEILEVCLVFLTPNDTFEKNKLELKSNELNTQKLYNNYFLLKKKDKTFLATEIVKIENVDKIDDLNFDFINKTCGEFNNITLTVEFTKPFKWNTRNVASLIFKNKSNKRIALKEDFNYDFVYYKPGLLNISRLKSFEFNKIPKEFNKMECPPNGELKVYFYFGLENSIFENIDEFEKLDIEIADRSGIIFFRAPLNIKNEISDLSKKEVELYKNLKESNISRLIGVDCIDMNDEDLRLLAKWEKESKGTRFWPELFVSPFFNSNLNTNQRAQLADEMLLKLTNYEEYQGLIAASIISILQKEKRNEEEIEKYKKFIK